MSELDRATFARAARSLTAFERWLDGYGELSQDPYDFWAASLGSRAKRLYYRRPLAGKLAAAPFVALDLLVPSSRRLARAPSRQPIADAHYARGFFELARSPRETRQLERGRSFLNALERTQSASTKGFAWGYTFDWHSRYGLFPAGTPLVTTIPYCYEAFEAGFDATEDESCLEMMFGIARFAAEEIPVSAVSAGVEASAYSPLDRTRVVNASAYRGFLLTAAGARFERDDWRDAGRRNIEFVLRSQHDDGSWPYATDRDDDFVDNFHTCFVLKNLAKVRAEHGRAVEDALVAGYSFYLGHLLDERGLPIPFAKPPRVALHTRELYDLAEGVNLARILHDDVEAARGVLARLVAELADRWQLADGHFVTCELLLGRNTVPYHRWAQAQAFCALAQLLAANRQRPIG
jgi:hypothetical protein